MPRYKKATDKPDRPFKRRYKALKHKQLTHVLANIPTSFWEEFQEAAKTHTSKKKLLPSSLKTIVDTKTPQQFNAKLAREDMLHEDPNAESHKGGGLSEAANSVFSAMWSHMPDSVQNTFTNPEYGDELTQLDTWNADVVQQAYDQDIDSRLTTIHGWVRIPKFDSPYVTCYWNPADNAIHAAVRGSISAEDWLYHDMGIVLANHPGENLVDDVRSELVEIAKEFPDSNLTLNSHSLGGALVTDSFLAANAEQKGFLDNYDTLNYFNAGSSPVANLDPIKEMLQDSRVKLFINKSDMISQTYNQVRPDSTPVTFAEASWNPAAAHGMQQWATDDKEQSKPVDWGQDFYTNFNNSDWDAGKTSQTAMDKLG